MRNIVAFPSRKSSKEFELEKQDADEVVRSMALVTQQLEMMLDLLRERVRGETAASDGVQEKAAG